MHIRLIKIQWKIFSVTELLIPNQSPCLEKIHICILTALLHLCFTLYVNLPDSAFCKHRQIVLVWFIVRYLQLQ